MKKASLVGSLLLSILITAQTVLAGPPSIQGLRYHIVDLGPAPTSAASSIVINDFSDVAFSVDDARGALLVKTRDAAGTPIEIFTQMPQTAIGLSTGATFNRPNSINSHGAVVGRMTVPENGFSNASKAYVFDGDGLQEIASPLAMASTGSHKNEALGLADNGFLVGYFSGRGYVSPHEATYAFATGYDGAVGMPFGVQSTLVDVNNAKVAIGYYEPFYTSGNYSPIFSTLNGTGWTHYPILPPTTSREFRPKKINDFAVTTGMMIHWVSANFGEYDGIWTLDLFTMQYVRTPQDESSDLNNWGLVVGKLTNRALLSQGTASQDLNQISDAAALGMTLYSGLGINNRGDIVGIAVSPQGLRYFMAFLTTPFTCSADLDGDGMVGARELDLVRRLQGEPTPVGDFNHNGKVDASDYRFLERNQGACTR